MLENFRVANLQIDINKYELFVTEIKFLKLIISINKIKINFAKTKMIIK